jgi:hypothetical protein
MRTQDSRLYGRVQAGLFDLRNGAIPVSVSFRFDPVSASATGKTFIAFSASADSLITLVARRSQPS